MSKVQLAGNASGTGIFTIASPNSNTDRTLTLPDNTGTLVTNTSGSVSQSMLASGVAGTGPAFLVGSSGGQTLTAGAWNRIALNNETYDTANCFNPSTYRFTPNVAGYYQVSGNVSILVTTASDTNILGFYKNGTEFVRGSRGAALASSNIAVAGSALVYLNGSTDYIELYVFSAAANALENNPTYSYMSGCLVRAA
jgi:hypothetical protein